MDAPRTAGRRSVIAMEALDGNAIAGSLFEYFGSEMTSVRGRCTHCGTVAPIAELAVYTRGTRRRRTLPDLRRRGDGAGEGPRLNRVPRRSVRTVRVDLAPTRSAHANRHSTHRREAILRRGWERLLCTAAFLRVHPKCR